MRMLFRVDAGPGIGLGHLSRCLALATALDCLGVVPVFLTDGHRDVLRRVTAHGFEAEALDGVELGSEGDLRLTLARAARHGCTAVVVDSYSAGEDYLESLATAGGLVVAIDDFAGHRFPCHLVVNGGAYAEHLDYEASRDGARFLLGPRYALLRHEFWDVPVRPAPGAVRNVLVTLGGGDPLNLLPRFLVLVDELPGDFAMTAVVGPFYESEEVEQAARVARRPVRLVRAPDTMRDLMLEADLAVSAAGQTLYELAATGTPAVAMQAFENQAGNLLALAERGCVLVAGRAEDPGVLLAVREMVTALVGDREARAAMSAAGRRLVDGQGAKRVAEELTALSP